jgi:hypothetical protein
MSIKDPNYTPRTRETKPLLRSEIEEAQRNTNSNKAAARWLGTSYPRYRKYAKLYGIFDQHTNSIGIGIDKGWSKQPTSIALKDILAGKHPTYSPAKLKNRLLARKKLKKECNLCKFNEERITDKQVPLMLNFIDGNRHNYTLQNLELLCYNCMFLTTGAPTVVNKNLIIKSFITPEKIPKTQRVLTTIADYHDSSIELSDIDMELTEEERQELQGFE